MKRLLCSLLVVGAAHVGAASVGAQEKDNIVTFMRAKLDHSQKILEGLALEDYGAIAKHAQELSLLSRAESWQVLQTPEYQRQSEDFRRSADILTESAKNKNLDGSALAFMEVTLKCVRCHKYVRHVRMAAAEPPAGPPLTSTVQSPPR